MLVTPFVFKLAKGMLPTIGETERIALEAGTVWWDKELFSGKPNWGKMLSFKEKELTDDELAFLDGPVETLCNMISDWDVSQNWDLPEEAWDYIKKEKFFGMIIPKNYGGLGFGARAHSEVVSKLASRSTATAVTVMVPNSLGPAELLLHYGTQEQKDHYLPRLASGKDIPCFGLTEPTAGSDAGALKSFGVVCKRTFEGKETLGILLNWEKRWITLSPIATVLGLAFVLKDPEGLLGKTKDLGITCALVPTNLQGVKTGTRHNPLHSSFHNGPTWGIDVFIPLDYIIGGQAMVGQGWRMLMESLAAGRSISLPALSAGNSKLSLRTTYQYGHVRQQFNLPIIKFEGVEEKLSNITALTYIIEAARTLTAGAVDAGEQPSVVSAIMKAYTTELGRNVINDAMDIRAGAAISLGPKNILGNVYTSMPISITVEGANILTRTLIIYGQGAIRCHPHIQDEIKAIGENHLKNFDRAFFKHIAFTLQNKVRAWLLALTHGYLARTPSTHGMQRYLQHLSRFSASFSFLSDVCMGLLGGALKRKEKLSGRLADILSWMYLTTAVIKKYEDDGADPTQKPIVDYAATLGLYHIQEAFLGVLDNLPSSMIGWSLKRLLFPWGRLFHKPTDHLGHKVVKSLGQNDNFNKLTQGIFLPSHQDEGLGLIEKTFQHILDCMPLDQKIKKALKENIITKEPNLFEQALEKRVISEVEHAKLKEREALKLQAIEVDDFKDGTFAKK